MNQNNDDLREILEKRASSYLNTTFALVSYKDDTEYEGRYAVQGTIRRYGDAVHVEVTFNKDDCNPMYWRITDEQITIPSQHLGTIQLSKDVCVSDPCYDRGVWCMTQLHNVKPGLWYVRVSIDKIDSWGKRVYVLELYQSETDGREKELTWKEHSELGVDSGTMSVFDDAYYRKKNGSTEEFEADVMAKDKFSNECFALSSNYAGFYRSGNKAVGVVCSSGCGDGSYPLEIVEIDGEVIAMKINFM